MAHIFDACVFGAGPAAVAVSARLLALGHDVAVLERPQTIRPWGGESFSGAIRGPLTTLGLWDEFTAAGHIRGYERQVAWGGEPWSESSIVHPTGHLWHVDRDRFDHDLREAVRRQGNIFIFYRELHEIERRSETWRLVLDEGKELAARYLVDATGRSRALAKRLGAKIAAHDRLIGLTSAVGPGCSFEVSTLLIQSAPFGWWYAAPVPRGHIVALFTDPDLAPSDVRRRLRPVPANSVFTDVTEDKGWVAVGDACASHDPLCGWGVQRALSNGILAAEAISHFLSSSCSSSLADYRDYSRKQFDAYLEGLTRHYSIERRWPDAPFWERRLDTSPARKEL
jgi:flavin-dependent dehydrogenase